MTRLISARLAFIVAGVVFGLISPAVAETISVDALTPEGAQLGTQTTDGDIDDLRFAVDLGGDTPEASHVWAIVGGARTVQRTNDGFWVPWNGDTDSLIDNQFSAANGQLTFKVLDEDIGSENQGITLGIGYRTGGVLKYGIYGILPASGGS